MKSRRFLALLLLLVLVSEGSAWGRHSKPWPSPLGSVTLDKVIATQLSHRELDPIEGVWLSEDQRYEIAIFKYRLEGYEEYDYIGIIVTSRNDEYKPGDLKCLFKKTAREDACPGRWYMANKDTEDGLFVLKDADTVSYAVDGTPSLLIRMRVQDKQETAASMGTGFVMAKGLIATNYHVVAEHQKFEVTLQYGKKVAASLEVYDDSNDLALLRLPEDVGVPALPMGRVSSVKAGAHVYTIGFPLPTDLGTNAKISEGMVNSITGFSDDPRMYQISVPTQPGNSGGPLLDNEGRVVGVVTCTLDNTYAFRHTGQIPQNVNFAMKINYLDNLLGVLPAGVELATVTTGQALDSAELMAKVEPSIVLITASD